MELSGSVDSEFSFPLSCNSALLSSVVLTKEKYSSRHFPQEAWCNTWNIGKASFVHTGKKRRKYYATFCCEIFWEETLLVVFM